MRHPSFESRYVEGPGCWEWQGARYPTGYGRFGRGRQVRAHRIAYERAYGPIPAGLFVCHHCDNPPCVRPDHLFLGTAADNTADRIAKGRGPRSGRPGLKGSRNPLAKLTEDDIPVIRQRLANGETGRSIGRSYGVAAETIYRIKWRTGWQDAA